MPANILDVFNEDAFSVTELSAAIRLMPFQPHRLGELKLFESKGIYTTTAAVERQGNKLALLPSTERGTVGTKTPAKKRDIRDLRVPHIPQHDTILANDLQNVRAFGEENLTETFSEITADRQEDMRQNHEVTEEWLRIGAIKGIIVDGDGTTTLHDLFAEFGVTQTEIDFDLGTATTEVKMKCTAVTRAIEKALGGLAHGQITGFCGDAFWDKLITHDTVKEAYDRWRDGSFLRDDQRYPAGKGGFEFANIWFENYRGSIGGTDFIPTNDCRFVVRGVPKLFITHYAPADYIETVNTKGKPFYSKQKRMDYDKGIELETQSNPLPICTRPNTLIRGFTAP